jgi:glycosyltransferase involved in cell wall biosynthesis
MPTVVHVVVTGNFAGVERYVCSTATELATRNWEVSVVGGDPKHMAGALGSVVRWLPGKTPGQALHSLTKLGRQDLCHVHMTTAELVAIAARLRLKAPIISTRHFAAHRGSTVVTRSLAPLISASIAREIAVSNFVARNMERRPNAVIINGVPLSLCLWKPSSRVVLVLQRLEREKDTLTALRAWQASRLWETGWCMRVVGDGSERQMLERWAISHALEAVVFAGWASDVPSELAGAGVLLAPAPSDSVGLVVLEAMAAGVPVVACGSGGHLETLGQLAEGLLFPPGDQESAAANLRLLESKQRRVALSAESSKLVSSTFTIARHVDRLLSEYEAAQAQGGDGVLLRRTRAHRPSRRSHGRLSHRIVGSGVAEPLGELVVCSLEAWDDVWRRNQFFVSALLHRHPGLRVLFVEPAADPFFDLASRRRPTPPRLRRISDDGRLLALRPLKTLPRRVGGLADALLLAQVRLGARALGFTNPTLWINDVTYAPLITATGWASLYDITDDWLLMPVGERERVRLRNLDQFALDNADEVVVCSEALLRSRGAERGVSLVQNGVDAEHFRRPRLRPADLPDGLVAVYVGSLHEARLDVDLVRDVARSLPQASIVLVGPNSLGAPSRRVLGAESNVYLLGPRPYRDVPAYLQHADVIIVPHRVTPFTENLDPIKAYECLAVATPTVATPIAGFRDHREFEVVDRLDFCARVQDVLLRRDGGTTPERPVPSWEERALEFESTLFRTLRRMSS